MNDTLQSLIRAVLKIGSGYLIAKGLTDANQSEAIISGLIASIAVAWGALHRATPTTLKCLALPALILALACGSGCSTPAPTAAYRAQGAAVLSADAAMTAWGDYVASHPVPIAQEQTVRDAYRKYQSAMTAAISATAVLVTLSDTAAPGWSDANAAAQARAVELGQAVSDVLTAINTFTK